MGKTVFSDHAEKKFLVLWGEMLKSSDKKMMSRKEKVSIVTRNLNTYMTEIGSKETYTDQQVNHKIDSAKVKGREMYRRYFKLPTGSSTAEIDVDLSEAYTLWSNFRTYHQCFSEHPTWGPSNSLEIAAGELNKQRRISVNWYCNLHQRNL
eukprot:scpid94527/ scgid22830/ 